MQKIDIIPLPILPLDESQIVMTVDILHYLSKYFGLVDIVKDNIVFIKKDLVAVRNITCAIY